MNDTVTQQTSEFVWRRMGDPIRLPFLTEPLPPQIWYFILGFVLLIGFFYIGWMYVKDSRGVGAGWATLLGLLRASVYGLLAWVFMLPATQTWDQSTARSKVVLAFDGSGSMVMEKDDPPTDKDPAGEKLLTRQGKVLAFLADPEKKFLDQLQENNPITAYRFGRTLDDQSWLFSEGRNWTRKEFEDPVDDKTGEKKERPRSALQPEFWQAWLTPRPRPGATIPKVTWADEWSEEDKDRLAKLLEDNEKKTDRGEFNATNVPGAVLGVLTREANNMVQGIVVFTDGRNTDDATQAYRDLAVRARLAKVPLFVVGVGDLRPKIKTEIVDLRVPQRIQPEDRFPISVEVSGEGLPDKEVSVEIDLEHVADMKNQGKDVIKEITLVEDDANKPEDKRLTIILPGKLTLKKDTPIKLDRSTPPRGQVDFVIDAAFLAKLAGKENELTAAKRWAIGQTTDSKFRFTARMPKDRLEPSTERFNVRGPSELRVLKKPLRVLLFCSAPTRDYQFLRTLMVREVEKRRAELSIHIQNPPGRSERRTGVVQDVEPDKLLSTFPDKYDVGSADPKEMLYDLANYDVVVAFDPDWNQLSSEQLNNLGTWANKGGGLVILGGPINTIQLARPGARQDKIKPVVALYPVDLEDARVEDSDRTPDTPWPLDLKEATPDIEFLKLDETENKPFLQDWQEFFNQDEKDGGSKRGFFNYYPVKQVKPGAMVLARFGDPKAKMKDGKLMPYIVVSPEAAQQRVVWIGSGEVWRLRQYREVYHERFWTKLLRYAGAKSQAGETRRINLYADPFQKTGRGITFDAKIDDRGGVPYVANSKDEMPKVKVEPIRLDLPKDLKESDIKKELIRPVVAMEPKKEKDRVGVFQVPRNNLVLRYPGQYEITVEVPRTGDKFTEKIQVEESDPERDNTQPDFGPLYQMASPAEEVLERVTDTAKKTVLERLKKPAVAPGLAQPGGGKGAEDKPRLFFDLSNADLIPLCMKKDTNTQRSRGAVHDWWDDGPMMWGMKIPWVLLVIVGLLSTEWLTRKLLRLA